MRIIANLPATFTREGKTYPLTESWTEPARSEQRFAYYNDEEGVRHFLCFNQERGDWQYLRKSQFQQNAPHSGGVKLNRMSASAELERIMRPITIMSVILYPLDRIDLQKVQERWPDIRNHRRVPNREYLLEEDELTNQQRDYVLSLDNGTRPGWRVPYEYRDPDEVKELLLRLHVKGYAFDPYPTWVLFYMPETKIREVLAGDLSQDMDRNDIIWG